MDTWNGGRIRLNNPVPDPSIIYVDYREAPRTQADSTFANLAMDTFPETELTPEVWGL